jgi:hypothetical protein
MLTVVDFVGSYYRSTKGAPSNMSWTTNMGLFGAHTEGYRLDRFASKRVCSQTVSICIHSSFSAMLMVLSWVCSSAATLGSTY